MAGAHDEILGIEYLDKVIDINQAPIGRTPDQIQLPIQGYLMILGSFAMTNEAKARGYQREGLASMSRAVGASLPRAMESLE